MSSNAEEPEASPDAMAKETERVQRSAGGDAEAVQEQRPKSSGIGRAIRKAFGKTDVYTWMLGLSLLAIAVAILCLRAELAKYDWDTKASRYSSTARLAE